MHAYYKYFILVNIIYICQILQLTNLPLVLVIQLHLFMLPSEAFGTKFGCGIGTETRTWTYIGMLVLAFGGASGEMRSSTDEMA